MQQTANFCDADVLGVCRALMCSQQARYVVGQSLVIDGGVGNTSFQSTRSELR